MKILCIGVGGIGAAVANTLSERGHNVTGVSRSKTDLLNVGVNHVQADVLSADFAHQPAIINPAWQVIIVTLTPSRYDNTGYELAYLKTAQSITKTFNHLKDKVKVIFISSTGVYGENSGEYCDENTPVNPVRARSKFIFDAENYYRQHFHHVCIIRPSGIYGLKRLRLLTWVKEQRPVAKRQWSNRIFDSDLVTIIANLAELEQFKPVYIATDNTPVIQAEVLDYIAEQLSLPKVTRKTDDSQESGKRLHSLYLPEEWLQYPTWQLGYQNILHT